MGFFKREAKSADVGIGPAALAWLSEWSSRPGVVEIVIKRILDELARHENASNRAAVDRAQMLAGFRAMKAAWDQQAQDMRSAIERLERMTAGDGAACKALSRRLDALEVTTAPRKCTCPPGGVQVYQQGGKCNHCLGIG